LTTLSLSTVRCDLIIVTTDRVTVGTGEHDVVDGSLLLFLVQDNSIQS